METDGHRLGRGYEIDTTAAAFMAGVPAHTIRNWAARGHLQPLRADGTRTIYDADAVIRVAMRFGYIPDPSAVMREEQCCVPGCTSAPWPEVPVPLCRDHSVAIWLHVNDEMAARVPRRERPGSPQPIVYFIQAGDHVKIGTTVSLRSRLDTLRTGSGNTLKILLVVPGGRAEEKQVHALFQADRIRGEWFTLSAALMDFITQRKDQDIRDAYGLQDD